ncbi:glycosyl hydrolase family 8 [Muricoccus radiodurans]|uniref:glycosyl hydrolase family 8 n=1 Tax=Muricoccus radiodurans TaxID=2231721 RepID=UPI003CEBBE0C
MPASLPRRRVFGIIGAAAGWLTAPRLAHADGTAAEWGRYKSRFLLPEGRVVDTGNNNQSHSEGQGWGLMLAEHHDDRPAFDAILRWTRANLRREGDMLHAWRFQPNAPVAVQDRNNATDGDLFIAAALLRGGQRWNEPAFTEEGTAIARDVLRLLVRRTANMLVLLPGSRGFEHRDRVVINPSYYSFPAIAVVAEAVPDPAWLRVASDGLRLLRSARFGRWGLAPDWLSVSRVDGRTAPAEGWPARFAYDAVRVPLWLCWAGLGDEPSVGRALDFWNDGAHRHLPAWADLATDVTSPYPAGVGIAEIGRLAGSQRNTPWRRPLSESRPQGRDYYDTSLAILARVAAQQVGRPLSPA